MERLNQDARRYLREIRKELPCARSIKRKILEEIKNNLIVFISESPLADYSSINARFGSPKQIAATYVNEAETGELLRKLRVRRKVITVVCATAAVLISIWVGAVCFMINNDAHQVENSVIYIEITEN